jgi:hypothetical protein
VMACSDELDGGSTTGPAGTDHCDAAGSAHTIRTRGGRARM